MKHTSEEKITYWKKRILDKIQSSAKQLALDFDEVWSNVRHIDLKTDKIREATEKIESALKETAVAVKDAKVRVNKAEKEVKGPKIVTPTEAQSIQEEK